MTCVHLRKLYELCQQNDIRMSSGDLVHIVCTQCGQKEVCPSMLLEEYEWDEADHAVAGVKVPPTDQAKS